jgi:hypothetical protein
VYTRVQTPRFCGQLCKAGLAVFHAGALRPFRTSWLNVGTKNPQKTGDSKQTRSKPNTIQTKTRPGPTHDLDQKMPCLRLLPRTTKPRGNYRVGQFETVLNCRTTGRRRSGFGQVHAHFTAQRLLALTTFSASVVNLGASPRPDLRRRRW